MHVRAIFLGALMTPLAACTAITGFGGYTGPEADGGPGSPDAPGTDAPLADGEVPPDTGPVDAGPRPCEPACGAGETCDDGTCFCGASPACEGALSCCDGECIDTDTSLTDCGACGTLCGKAPNTTPSCAAGSCMHTCVTGWENCNGLPEDGCEVDLTTPMDCGGCGDACDPGDVCSDGSCRSTCGSGETNCSGTCADTRTSLMHCGACGNACTDPPNASPTCAGSTCGFVCDGDFQDCDGMMANGCEVIPPIAFRDMDGDGYGVGAGMRRCGPGTGWSTAGGDCDDTNNAIYPTASELCNAVNDDCDGATDEGYLLGTTCSCTAGAAPGAIVCATPTTTRCNYPAEVCNGLDDDCNARPDDTFACVRGSTMACNFTGPGGAVCMGSSTCGPTCNWSAVCMPPADICGNGMDEDCNDFVDDGTLAVGPRTSFEASPVGIQAAWRPASGDGAVVYFVGPVGSGRVFARFFDRAGLPSSDPPIVLASGSTIAPPVAAGWDGTSFHAAWTTTAGQVQYATFDPTGVGTIRNRTGSRVAMASFQAGNGVAILIRNGNLLEASVFSSLIPARGFFTLSSVAAPRQWDDIAIAPTTGTEVVGMGVSYMGTPPAGQLHYRTFTNSPGAEGPEQIVLADGAMEARPSAAYEPVSRRIAIGYEIPSIPETRVSIFVMSSATLVSTQTLPATANQVVVNRLGFPGSTPGVFLITHSAHTRRLEPDGTWYPEMITGFRTTREAISTPNGTYVALTFDQRGAETAFHSQGLGCP